jgi:hypothetical protein
MIFYLRAVQNLRLAVLLRNLMRVYDLVHIPYVYHISLYLLSYKYRHIVVCKII